MKVGGVRGWSFSGRWRVACFVRTAEGIRQRIKLGLRDRKGGEEEGKGSERKERKKGIDDGGGKEEKKEGLKEGKKGGRRSFGVGGRKKERKKEREKSRRGPIETRHPAKHAPRAWPCFRSVFDGLSEKGCLGQGVNCLL